MNREGREQGASGQQSVQLIGMAGGSCSGKTTLVRLVAGFLGPGRACQLSFDSYYRPLDGLASEERARVNFDHPDSLDLELFLSHLDALRAATAVEQPVYDFATHSRRPETVCVGPAPIVLVDGILLLSFPEVVERLDRTIFLSVPEEVRLARRVARDTVERGRSEASVRRQFGETVAPMHRQFVEPGGRLAQRVIPHGVELPVVARELAEEWSTGL